MEARGEKINFSSGPSKVIGGTVEEDEDDDDDEDMTLGSQDSRVCEFSHEALKVRRGLLGLWSVLVSF